MPDVVDSIDVAGRRRTYAFHVPDGPAVPARPLIVVLHGRRSNGLEMRRLTHFDAVADRFGFVVAYPDGHRHSWNDGHGNTPAEREQVDDVAFIRRLIDRLADQAGAHPERAGVTGLSNGAMMCHRLGLELGDRITAIAPVAGPMPVALAQVAPAHAVSMLLIHGTSDRAIPIGGGRTILGGPHVLSVADTVARWCAIDGCETETAHETLPASGRDRTSVERSVSAGGRGGTAVESWIVHRGGHTWPGGPHMVPLGRTSTRFDASEVIARFVASHLEPAAERYLGDSASA